MVSKHFFIGMCLKSEACHVTKFMRYKFIARVDEPFVFFFEAVTNYEKGEEIWIKRVGASAKEHAEFRSDIKSWDPVDFEIVEIRSYFSSRIKYLAVSFLYQEI